MKANSIKVQVNDIDIRSVPYTIEVNGVLINAVTDFKLSMDPDSFKVVTLSFAVAGIEFEPFNSSESDGTANR